MRNGGGKRSAGGRDALVHVAQTMAPSGASTSTSLSTASARRRSSNSPTSNVFSTTWER